MNNWQLSFIAGCTFSLFFPTTPEFFWFFIGFLTLCCAIYIKSRLFAAFAMGLAYVMTYLMVFISWDLPQDSHWRSSTVTGSVTSVSSNQSCGVFTLSVISSKPFKAPLLAPQIRIYNNLPQFCPSIGETLTLQIRLKPSHLLLNKSVTRFPANDFFHRRLTQGTLQKVIEQRTQTLDLRNRWLNDISNELASLEHGGVITALMFGERRDLSQATQQLLKNHGVGHLLAISGLHIGLVFLFSYWLTALLARLLPVTTHPAAWLYRKALCSLIPFLIALSYSFLAGFAVSTVRAVVMLGVACSFVLLQRRSSPFSIVNSVNFAVVLLYPFTLLSFGYWLSFGAVYCILVLNWLFPVTAEYREKPWFFRVTHWFWQLVRLQGCLFIGLMPLSILLFGGIAVNGLTSNLFAIPVVSFVVIPCVLIGLVFWIIGLKTVSSTLWDVANWALNHLFTALENADWMGWLVFTPAFFPWVLCVWLVPCLLVKPWRKPVLLLSFCVLAKSPLTKLSAEQTLQVHVLAIGQGTSVVLQRGNEAVIYDVGPAFPPFYDTATAILLPWLKAHDIQKLHTLILSHEDNDHSGAAATLLAQRPVDYIFISETFLAQPELTSELKVALQKQGKNQLLSCDDVDFMWRDVHIESIQPKESYSTSNDNSCVVKASFHSQSILLPGDISRFVEFDLIKNHNAMLRSTILIAPHHGSNSSSSWSFINRVSPQHVVFTTGFRNRFRFPKPEVVERYQHSERKLWDTSIHGQTTFILTTDGVVLAEAATQRFFSSWLYQYSSTSSLNAPED